MLEGSYSQRGEEAKYRRYDKGNSYKRKSGTLATKLEDLLEECQTARERDAICDCIDRLSEM